MNDKSIAQFRAKKREKRKDKGLFKAPMASVLTGLDCNTSEAKILLKDEKRSLDSIEIIAEEVKEFMYNTSEAPSGTTVCNIRGLIPTTTASAIV